MLLTDFGKYWFWWCVFKIWRLLVNIFLNIVPMSGLKAAVQDEFEKRGVKVTFDAKQAGKYDKTKFACEAVVHNDAMFRTIAFNDTLGIGEAYMDGWWDCDDISEFTNCTLKLPLTLTHILSDKVELALSQQQKGKMSLRVAQEHYDLGNDLYSIMLDKTMNYTCGLWYPGETKTLEESQINKMDLIGRKLKLKPGMKVLDIGSGFGATAEYFCRKFGVHVTCYNISQEQVAYARERSKGLDIDIVVDDYRHATGQFDAIYSIGFFEAVGSKQFREYYEIVERCLKPNGLALTHTIVRKDGANLTDRWLCKYIFPGGELPYLSHLVTSNTGLLIVEDVHSLGKSYAKTLRCWRDNFRKNWDAIEKNYKDKFGGRFYRMFDFYLALCEGAFKDRSAQLYQVVYSKNYPDEEYVSIRDKRE